ncbi:potassium-transporting ATPase subunit KdpC [Corynebacterium fournieri]|uniref:potassium-transporting ATPase subunit KdpC n=1 Tax=Corynebacterium fournieri TaxID=1852390 RepID=UPI000A2F4A7E|nr:potassium-transporting ATPase subunit KdpC [Corynebacterium fournieri]WJY97469.1 Potassium-transporting ATPase C chain [Corynebacterium fournieri]
MNTLRQTGAAFRALLVLTVILGIAYPLLMVGIGRLMPAQADGSLQRNGEDVVGSKLIAQPAGGPEFFRPRPSAGDWDGEASGGSNLSPASRELRDRMDERRQALEQENPDAGEVPAEALTASSSGLDPHISPEYAHWQAPRIAGERGMDRQDVDKLIEAHTKKALLGFFGQDTVNVNELNYSLEYEG